MTVSYTNNCPTFAEYYDPGQPISHSKPVSHLVNVPLVDWHPACVWAQLDWERERGAGGPEYRENLEGRWQELNLCSGCLRELDHPFMTEVDDLRLRLARAESKIAAIRDTGHYPDAMWRSAVVDILEREEEPFEQAAGS